jgi:hypothetical protein
MIRKIAFTLLLALQFSVVANLAFAYSPIPVCYPGSPWCLK